MAQRAVVTGGAGFVGSNLVDLLVDEGWDTLVVDDLSSGRMDHIAGARQRGEVAVHITDIRAPELVEVVRRFEPEVIFHLAAQSKVRPSVDDPIFDADVNILGTLNVLDAARQSGARKVVFASSGGAIYGEGARLPAKESAKKRPASPCGISKKVVEDYFRWFNEMYGVEYTLVAPANIYGPRQDPSLEGGVVAIFIAAMLEERRPVIYGDGTQTRDFLFVEDMCDAFLRAASKGDGRLLNVGTGIETSVNDLYEVIAGATGYRDVPINADPKPGDVLRNVVDPSAARSVLGWEAWTALEAGIERTVEWYRRSR